MTRRVEGEQSFDRSAPMFGVLRRMRAPRCPTSLATSAVPWKPPLAERPPQWPSDCNVGATVSSRVDDHRQQPLQCRRPRCRSEGQQGVGSGQPIR